MEDNFRASDTSLLLLASESGMHAKQSGYTALSNYLSGALLLKTNRHPPIGFPQRAARAIVGAGAITGWYQLASLELEYKARKLARSTRAGILHFLWADNDLGFIDLIAKNKYRLCCTFHQPIAVLSEIIRYPGRLKAIDSIILMSETQREFFLNHGVDNQCIHVVPHGVDTRFFSPKTRSANSVLTAISVGSYRRNFHLLRATALRLANQPDIRFRVIASAGYRPLFSDCKNVDFVSGISDLELLEAYRSADCYILTASDATANNALLEAMACGTPVVAERAGGIPEYVSKQCAILCDPDEPESMAETVKSLLHSVDRLRCMRSAARERALQLDWTKVAAQTQTLYSALKN